MAAHQLAQMAESALQTFENGKTKPLTQKVFML